MICLEKRLLTNNVKNDTTHSFVLNITDPLKYYQVIVEDKWGFFSESSIVQAEMPFTMLKNYGGNQDDRGYAVQQTSDGGYVIVGSSTSYGAGGSDLWILKVDASGEFTWSKTYGGQGNDVGKDIVQTSDGGYIITGYTRSFSSGGDMDLWLIKTDANGESCLYNDGGICTQNSSKWVKSFGTINLMVRHIRILGPIIFFLDFDHLLVRFNLNLFANLLDPD